MINVIRRPLNDVCLALWEFQVRHKSLPGGNDGEREEIASIADGLREALGVNAAAVPKVAPAMLEYVEKCHHKLGLTIST